MRTRSALAGVTIFATLVVTLGGYHGLFVPAPKYPDRPTQPSRFRGACMPPLPGNASFEFRRGTSGAAEVVYGPTRRTGVLPPVDLPGVKGVLFCGNSVTRHWFAVAEQLWQEKHGVVQKSDCMGGYRELEKERCKSSNHVCSTTVSGLRLSFLWQQSVYSPAFEIFLFGLLREYPGGDGLVVVMNMGLDFLADQRTRPRWAELTRRLAPSLASLLQDFLKQAPFAVVVFKTSTALCGVTWGLGPEEGNDMLVQSNGVLAEAVRGAQAVVYDNIERWRGGYTNKSGHTPTVVPREPLLLFDMFGATACSCKYYEDKVHHCQLGKGHVYTLFEVLSRYVLGS